MGIFSRFTDIVNANLNALLDKAEDPQKMVRLIIQEMEDTLVEVRSVSAKTLSEKKDLVRQLTRLEGEIVEWERRAELALGKEREDLARQALLEKSKLQDTLESLQAEIDRVDDHVERLSGEITQLQEKLADAKARQKSILMRERTVSSRLNVKKTLDSGKVDDALHKFERYEAKIDDLESQVEAYDLGKKTLADEFRALESENKVDAELEALKARLNKDTAKKEDKA
ncbi:phage shock protein PspA [Aliidiomarina haloalkalitolerans]|uniref:Phage shock protein PspA n=1 Tax=Aliidiomarina haloalkalitolerans TaxID=859059 RepID=A0A432VY52_9GAMM|nr:phage shock protein PspA [Aliidiomarina haloalkalitolerans]MCL4409855.1 phage shock protein PspA [Gammaproteobacteria bacterium]RUO21576.1 phage shock protein PspA [Aliidiomarina haloalkalitolerans]